MTTHHLNCATMTPFGAPALVAHCLLVERPDGLVLVDTGLGTDDLATPKRLGQPFRALVRPVLDASETALARVRALGHDPADVTDIVLTHLDLDHAGGISDFPSARVHVFTEELEAALHPTLRERARYLADHWAHGPSWVQHEVAGDDWFGFSSVTALDDDVLLVPLHGHTRGHCGVAVRRGDGGWLLHAGDAYFNAGEKLSPPSCPRALQAFQTVVAVDNRRRRSNQERLQELHAAHVEEVAIFSAHDASEFAALQQPAN